MPLLLDKACIDLAKSFLSDLAGATAADVNELAGEIQAVCEDVYNTIEERETTWREQNIWTTTK